MDISIQDLYVSFLIIMLICIYLINVYNPPEQFEQVDTKMNVLGDINQIDLQTQMDILFSSDEIEGFSIMNPHI